MLKVHMLFMLYFHKLYQRPYMNASVMFNTLFIIYLNHLSEQPLSCLFKKKKKIPLLIKIGSIVYTKKL